MKRQGPGPRGQKFGHGCYLCFFLRKRRKRRFLLVLGTGHGVGGTVGMSGSTTSLWPWAND